MNVWLDCDIGHDDSIALLLALHSPSINLLGISTTHGNASLIETTQNASRVLCSIGTTQQIRSIPIYSGAAKPLTRKALYAPNIHGADGLGGVEGLLSSSDPVVERKIEESQGKNAINAIVEAVKSLPEGEELNLVACGPLTNIALFVQMYPELIKSKVNQIVLMGGAEGRGNVTPTAEFNIFADPEAASIVFNAEVKVVIMPLNLTHTVIFTKEIDDRLLKRSNTSSPHSTGASTQVRHTLSTLLNFFGETYEKVFAFDSGPPVHDPLTIFYLLNPSAFKTNRYRVDVELSGSFTAGTTIIDLWNYQKAKLRLFDGEDDSESWGREGRNVLVAEEVDVEAFWEVFLESIDRADKVAILNKSQF